MHTCIHAYMHTCIHAYMHTCIHAYMHTYAYAYRHAYICTYVLTCLSNLPSAYLLLPLMKTSNRGFTFKRPITKNLALRVRERRNRKPEPLKQACLNSSTLPDFRGKSPEWQDLKVLVSISSWVFVKLGVSEIPASGWGSFETIPVGAEIREKGLGFGHYWDSGLHVLLPLLTARYLLQPPVAWVWTECRHPEQDTALRQQRSGLVIVHSMLGFLSGMWYHWAGYLAQRGLRGVFCWKWAVVCSDNHRIRTHTPAPSSASSRSLSYASSSTSSPLKVAFGLGTL